MFIYRKKLQYPVRIERPNPALAKIVISQYGGPNGELGASLRYLSQRYSMPTDELKGILTDIGTEGSKRLPQNLDFAAAFLFYVSSGFQHFVGNGKEHLAALNILFGGKADRRILIDIGNRHNRHTAESGALHRFYIDGQEQLPRFHLITEINMANAPLSLQFDRIKAHMEQHLVLPAEKADGMECLGNLDNLAVCRGTDFTGL